MNLRGKFAGGLALVLVSTASTAAFAQCTGTGGAAGLSASFGGFASGGAISTLVSSINIANTAFLTQSTAFVGSPPNPQPNQEGGGIWVRGIGGEINTRGTTTSTFTLGGAPVTGSVSCNTRTNLQFAGTQVGTDMARLNWNGWNVHVGAMAGYLGSTARDRTPGGALNTPGSLVSTLEVPFAGFYAAATYGSFFIDGQVRWDYYQNSVNDPVNSGLFNQRVDARGLAFTANAGYNFQLQNNWFIEPSVGIVVSNTRVDTLSAAGTFIQAALPFGLSLPNDTKIADIESTLGRLSIRGGTTIVTDRMIWQPFATVSVFHEFAGPVRSNYAEVPAFSFLLPPALGANLTSSNVGTYGQYALGVAGQVIGTGWLGYVRADYRNGDRIDGWSANAGLRYQFTPDQAPLAPKGLITKAPLMVRTAYNWTGFYVGAQFGALYGWTDWTFQPGGTKTSPRFAGALAGGQAGYDWQTGKWVFGVEGSIDFTNSKGARACPNGNLFTCQMDHNWFGTATARVGYALWDRSIIYLKGGAAFAEERASFRCNTDGRATFGITLIGCPGPGQSNGQTQTKVGWTVGYGTEFALSQNWTVKSETSYFDLGRTRYNLPQTGFAPAPVDVSSTGVSSIIALNYRFAGR